MMQYNIYVDIEQVQHCCHMMQYLYVGIELEATTLLIYNAIYLC